MVMCLDRGADLQNHTCAETAAYSIWMKFCVSVGIPDIITCANFVDDQLRGLRVVGSQILLFCLYIRYSPYKHTTTRVSVDSAVTEACSTNQFNIFFTTTVHSLETGLLRPWTPLGY